MKKGTKAVLWIAAGCFLLGSILLGTGFIAGGYGELGEVSDNPIGVTFEGNTLHIGPKKAAEGDFFSQSTGFFIGEETVPGQEVLSGDFTRNFPRQGLYELEIRTGVHELDILESAVDQISVEGVQCDQIQCFTHDGRLRILDVGKKKAGTELKDRRIRIIVPEGMQWTEVELEAAKTSVNAEVIRTQECDLTVDIGSIDVENLTAAEADLEAGMGNVSVKNADIGNLDVSADMGAVTLEGEVLRNVEADANMGAVILKLGQKEADFNYQMKASMGNIELDGKKYSGLDKEKMINNQADQTMKLEASMGSIEITFQ